jgi:hypothetical protein
MSRARCRALSRFRWVGSMPLVAAFAYIDKLKHSRGSPKLGTGRTQILASVLRRSGVRHREGAAKGPAQHETVRSPPHRLGVASLSRNPRRLPHRRLCKRARHSHEDQHKYSPPAQSQPACCRLSFSPGCCSIKPLAANSTVTRPKDCLVTPKIASSAATAMPGRRARK